MPKVGKKTFAYTPRGEKHAAVYAKKTGGSIVMKKAMTNDRLIARMKRVK